MNDHMRAILQQLPEGEREVFERDPGRAWLAQMQERFSNMTVPDAVAALRAERDAIGKLPSVPPTPAQAAAPLHTGDAGRTGRESGREPHEPTASARPTPGQTAETGNNAPTGAQPAGVNPTTATVQPGASTPTRR